MTIADAVVTAMKAHRAPLTAKEAYDIIIAKGLYEFRAKNPVQVVLAQIRRHCEGIDLPNPSPNKFFCRVDDKRFALRE